MDPALPQATHGQVESHKAVFEGVDNANEIRDLIVERLREYRELGLGSQSDGRQAAVIAPDTALLAGLHDVPEEAIQLRLELQKTPS